jgi:segregation and condensation protein B
MSNPPQHSTDEPEPQGVSLRGLSEAFAQAIARQRAADEPAGAAPPSDASTETESAEGPSTGSDACGAAPLGESAERFPGAAGEPQPPEADETCPLGPRSILEAMLFVGDPENRPLEAARAAEFMRDIEPADIPALVEELNESYRLGGCPYRIRGDAAGYRLALGEKYHRVRDKFYGRIRLARLSQAAIDVLAIVAYRQPLGADEVSRLRDKPSHHLLAQLVRRQLLRVERPKEGPRKPLYHTTDRFLELFGLESLADLPESAELPRE